MGAMSMSTYHHIVDQRVSKQAKEVSCRTFKLQHRSNLLFLQQGMSCAMTEMYDAMKEGGMSFLEFAHTVDEILFTNIGAFAFEYRSR